MMNSIFGIFQNVDIIALLMYGAWMIQTGSESRNLNFHSNGHAELTPSSLSSSATLVLSSLPSIRRYFLFFTRVILAVIIWDTKMAIPYV